MFLSRILLYFDQMNTEYVWYIRIEHLFLLFYSWCHVWKEINIILFSLGVLLCPGISWLSIGWYFLGFWVPVIPCLKLFLQESTNFVKKYGPYKIIPCMAEWVAIIHVWINSALKVLRSSVSSIFFIIKMLFILQTLY